VSTSGAPKKERLRTAISWGIAGGGERNFPLVHPRPMVIGLKITVTGGGISDPSPRKLGLKGPHFLWRDDGVVVQKSLLRPRPLSPSYANLAEGGPCCLGSGTFRILLNNYHAERLDQDRFNAGKGG